MVTAARAIEAVYPDTQMQLCIVHLIRNCLRDVPWKDRTVVVADLKPIYQAARRSIPPSPAVGRSTANHWLQKHLRQLYPIANIYGYDRNIVPGGLSPRSDGSVVGTCWFTIP